MIDSSQTHIGCGSEDHIIHNSSVYREMSFFGHVLMIMTTARTLVFLLVT